MSSGMIVRGAYFQSKGEHLGNWVKQLNKALTRRGYESEKPTCLDLEAEGDPGERCIDVWRRHDAPSLHIEREFGLCLAGGQAPQILRVATPGYDWQADSPAHFALYRALVAEGVLHAVTYFSGGAMGPALPGEMSVGHFTNFVAWWRSCSRRYWGAPDAVRLQMMLDEAQRRTPCQSYGSGLDWTLLHRLNLLGCPELIQRWEVGRVRRELARDPRFARAASNPPH